MNEALIRELANKAGLAYLYDYDSDGHAMVCAAVDVETLIKLVMQECIRVPYDMWDKSELNADIAIKIEHKIKQHFGVEE